tara:strand:+ start:1728 stop:2552 length:825 start_codon:yes stop_codon:yes gene_type:complete
MNHKTISQPIEFKGIGIHSGKEITMTCNPSTSGSITVINSKDNNTTLPLTLDTLAESHKRATLFKNKFTYLSTPEHFLSACAAYSITSLEIHINGHEIPILDGSSIEFCKIFGSINIQEITDKPLSPIIINTPLTIWYEDACIIATPAAKSIFSYFLSYDHPLIKSQSHTIELTESTYINDVAPARTYGFKHEVDHLIKQGLAKGGSLDNALIIGDDNYINEPRFTNECARHKLLDLIGDCWVLNRPIIGHIIGIKSGHHLNHLFTKALATSYS